MNRKQTATHRMTDHQDDNYVPGTQEERILLVWPLTREISSVNKKYDAEQRLQRDITRLIRRER